MPRTFKVAIEYDGTDYHGFQYQAGQQSIQGEIEKAVERLTGQAVRVNGAGRTDTGVHALGQVVSFRAETAIPTEKLSVALNSALPRDIRAVGAEETDERFHARFSAKRRAYVYVVLNREHPSAVFGRYTYHWPRPLDLDAMRAGAARLTGVQDFAAWANATDETVGTVREIHVCRVRRARSFVLVQIEANAFLRGMVRNIVGTLMEVGSGKRRPEEIAEITRSCQRANAGPSAPARGLCLVRVKY
jgi:tRNA pseudouridine38-40 synthase